MARGKQTRVLRQDQIERLIAFKLASHEGAAHGYSYPQLRSAMSASFGWETLKKALGGLPVWDLHYNYIELWIERHLPAGPAVMSQTDERHKEKSEAVRALRRE